MSTKEFHARSNEHAGIEAGTKFKTIKPHHDVNGDVEVGVELILESIAHFPTRYILKDEAGREWMMPIHSVEKIEE